MTQPDDTVSAPALKRRHLRAGLAAQRAELLWQLVGLEAQTLASDPVAAGWSANDLLAHVARWDDRYRQRIELRLGGRPEGVLQVGGPDSIRSVSLQREDGAFEQILGALLSARKGFLDALARSQDAELRRSAGLLAADDSERAWAERLCRHDALHARQLAGWRRRRNIQDTTGPKSLLAAAVRAARKELLTVVALVHQEAPTERRPHGILHDALASVADRERRALDLVRSSVGRTEGGPGPGAGHQAPQSAADEPRPHTAAGLANQRPWKQVWRDLHDTHQQLLHLLAGLDEVELERTVSPELDTTMPIRWEGPTSVYACFRLCAAHDREQATALRAALAAR